MGYSHTHLSAATAAADTDFYVLIGNGVMKNAAYTLSNTDPPEVGIARQITVTHASVGGVADTLGILTVIGKVMSGQTVTEVITPVADQAVTSTHHFAKLVSITGSGWARNAGAGSEDTIIVGCEAGAIVADGQGEIASVIVNTTAAGAITIADAGGTIGVLKASIGEGIYPFLCNFSGFLQVTLADASDVTIVHSGSLPSSYSM